ncbi:hypothetical protein RHSIM_Rhsim06G0090500 [Rhododendron simsii]|uniref:Uncharacterized protein n=1 Tax=Rhododendron simsii TaxID=118357 RepID=A0A834GUY0_RHOSS|nr:hypothetical protein RHSIM_Rhsim06G0090500 [Rhododendron simsii]
MGNGKQKAACEQSIQGQVVTIAGLHPSSTSTGTFAIQASTDELSDSEDELLEVLENPCDSHTPHGMIGPQPLEVKGVLVHSGLKLLEPPNILGSGVKGRAAEKFPIGGLVTNKSLSKSAKKRLRKLVKEQTLCSLSSGGI